MAELSQGSGCEVVGGRSGGGRKGHSGAGGKPGRGRDCRWGAGGRLGSGSYGKGASGCSCLFVPSPDPLGLLLPYSGEVKNLDLCTAFRSLATCP